MSPRSSRCGMVLSDLSGALLVVPVLMLLASIGAAEIHRQHQADERSAQLEIAENLLDACRHARTPVLPAGWHLVRHALGSEAEELRVVGPACSLATVVPLPARSPSP